MSIAGRHPLLMVALALLAGLSLWQAAGHLGVLLQDPPYDHALFAEVGHRFWQSGQFYARVTEPYPTFLPGTTAYKFPPMYQLAIAPWVRDGVTPAYESASQAAGLLMYLAGVGLLLGLALRTVPAAPRERQVAFCLLAVALAALYEPFHNSMMLLVGELPIFLCSVLVLACLPARPLWAGLLVATAVCLKLYPVYLLLSALLLRGLRPMLRMGAGFVLGVAGWTSLSVAVFGWPEHQYYLTHILPVLLGEYPMTIAGNLNALFFFIHEGVTHAFATQAFLALRLLVLAMLLAQIAWHARHPTVGQERLALLYGLLVTAMIASLANYWIQYELLLLVPALIALAHCLLARRPLCLLWVLLTLLVLLSSPELQERLLLEALEGVPASVLSQATVTDPIALLARHAPLALWVQVLVAIKPLAPYSLLACLSWLAWRPAPANRA